MHGTILHGNQYLDRSFAAQPTTYYTNTSGIGRLLEVLHPRAEPLKVGVIGLGTGTLATYGAKGDIYRFYDINPAVIAVAQRDFTYLSDSDATIETALGDARLSLEREPPQKFDVLAIDAFSSDAIPVHLITAEALAIYRKHMKPGGVIAFHVTNRFLEPRAGRRGARRRARTERGLDSPTRARARSRAAATGCCCRTTTRVLDASARSPRRATDRGSGRTGGCGPTTSTTWSRC